MNLVYIRARNALLRGLKVPHDPAAPAGAPGSLRIFRAGRNYYRLNFWLWAAKHGAALVLFVIILMFFHQVTHHELARWQDRAEARGKAGQVHLIGFLNQYSWCLPAFECVFFSFALLQLPFSYALIRLDFEQRWYLVTDRSLRIRSGIWNVREMTLSFANVQQITLKQGPLQRLLGLSDLVVTTAGGGGSSVAAQPGQQSHSWHTGILHAVENANEIRDLIQDRLRRLKSSGTGDHDDPEPTAISSRALADVPPTSPEPAPVLAAARELLAEIRALRSGW